MYVVGESLPSAVRGESTMLEHLTQDLLEDFYVNGSVCGMMNNWLGLIAKQITHRYPRMKILEIGKLNPFKLY